MGISFGNWPTLQLEAHLLIVVFPNTEIVASHDDQEQVGHWLYHRQQIALLCLLMPVWLQTRYYMFLLTIKFNRSINNRFEHPCVALKFENPQTFHVAGKSHAIQASTALIVTTPLSDK